jgi:hypothetical protein
LEGVSDDCTGATEDGVLEHPAANTRVETAAKAQRKSCLFMSISSEAGQGIGFSRYIGYTLGSWPAKRWNAREEN